MASFTISPSGSYPKEIYNIVPVDYNNSIVSLSSIPAENLFRFVKNPLNDINFISDFYNQINYNYSNSTYYIDSTNKFLRRLSSNTSDNTFTWNVSSLRQYNAGHIFNYMNMNFSPAIVQTRLPISSLNILFKSYLLYPSRLFLTPISASYNSANNTYSLTTSAVVLSATTYFFSSSTAEFDAYNQHLAYVSTLPKTFNIRNGNSTASYNLVYGLSAYKNVSINPVINFTDDFNPTSHNYSLESSPAVIKADSLFVKHRHVFDYNQNRVVIGQHNPDEFPNYRHGFRSSFIHNFNLSTPNTQTFQLIQSASNLNYSLLNYINTILSVNVNLTSCNFNYNSLSYIDPQNNIINAITGVNDTSLDLRYVAESPYFFNTNTPITNSLNAYIYNYFSKTNSSLSLNTKLTDNVSAPIDNVNWVSSYPPHYYSYKISLFNSDYNSLADTSTLNFTLSTWTINYTTSSFVLSSALCSNFNALNLDLPTYGRRDLISLNVIDDTINPIILSSLQCFYGTNSASLTNTYDLINSPYIPASSAPIFKITYPNTPYGQFNLTCKTSLSTSLGFITDANKANVLLFAQDIPQIIPSYPIRIRTLSEKQNLITLDSSYLNLSSGYPTRDLTNSLIVWSLTCNSPLSSNIALYSLDRFGVPTYIPSNSAITFNSSTWTINVSGYGPIATTIGLSSQRYNEFTTVQTNSALFDYFSEKTFAISATPVNLGLNTANFSLVAKLPNQGTLYNIPSATPMYWTWVFDGNNNPETQPLTAYDTNGNLYNFGSNNFAYNISSLNLSVYLSSGFTDFLKHDVRFTLVTHREKYDITGYYDFIFQDYPDRSIFNTDFKAYYYGYPNLISDTRIDKNVITRPNTDTNSYTFVANNDILPKIKAAQFAWSITDNLGHNVQYSSSDINSISSVHYVVDEYATQTTVTLCAISAYPEGWTIPHNIKSTITINTLPSSQFYAPVKFLVYPQYTWLEGNNGLVTLLSSTNFTISQAPTAYGNKVSNSQAFYLSANTVLGNDEYVYDYGENQYSLIDTTSSVVLAEFPYINEMFTFAGVPVYLTAFNALYPRINGTTYLGLNGDNNLYTGYFPVTAKTVPFNNSQYGGYVYYTNTNTTSTVSFTNTGNNSFTVPAGVTTLTALIIAGGGGGGVNSFNTSNGGGGSAGTVILSTIKVTPYQTYDIFVGSGGTPDYSYYSGFSMCNGLSGQNTIAFGVTAIGGVGGNDTDANGGNGAGGYYSYSNGGIGVINPISGSTIGQLSAGKYYIGGGGGGVSGFGGLGGGANAGSNALINTGGGGGGGNILYGVGGSGAVILSYYTTVSAYKAELSAFNQNPKIVPYDSVTQNFSAIDTSIVFDYNTITQQGVVVTPVTSIDLDNNIYVGVIQTMSPPNTANSPVVPLQDEYNGSFIYSLSSEYWTYTRYVPAVNGIFELFALQTGDPSQGLTVSPMKRTNLILSCSGEFPVWIPPTTFSNYTSTDYTSSRNLWKQINQASPLVSHTISVYSTSVKPEIYISSYYALTGDPIFIQFDTPENTEDIYITSYKIYFGDGSEEFHYVGDTTYHTYSATGVYVLSYEVNYNNGQTLSFELEKHPITVYETWPKYDQSKIRLLTEEILTLPWTIDDVYIQPNEYGDSDIFNTAIKRLHDCFQYILDNTQTINTDFPTLFYGWMGCNGKELAKGIQWYTLDYNAEYQQHTEYAVSNGTSFFSNIKDITLNKNHIYVLDGTNFRAFSAEKTAKEITFDNINAINQLLVNPVSIETDEEDNVYISDSFTNKVYKFNLSFDYISEINVQLSVGNFGGKNEPLKFNSPQEISFVGNHLYVHDYNNSCIKQYTNDLNWVKTYYIDDFENYKPVNFAIHPQTLFVYVLTNNGKVYVLDNNGNYITNFPLTNILSIDVKPVKIIFDEGGDFMYVISNNLVLKYTILGNFIALGNIPYGTDVTYSNGLPINYTSARSSFGRSIVLSTNNSILKFHDIVTLFKIGEGLNYQFWDVNQITLSREQFVDDISYNMSFDRLVQNIKSFRNIVDSRFVIVTEQKPYGTIEYYAKSPISIYDRPSFSDDIEFDNVKVGVNEFNIPQVLNRELVKIYDALNYLADYLSITDVNSLSSINTGCGSPFCWSWKAMSCYNLSLPVIRICNINPITYAELESGYPQDYLYANTNIWGKAISDKNCCPVSSPLG